MNAHWADGVAVGLAVVGAATWLGFRLRRYWRRQKESAGRSCACASGCDGCPFAKGCNNRGARAGGGEKPGQGLNA